MTGLELLKSMGTTMEEIADNVSEPCPPVVPTECDRLSCRECWLAWLMTGEPPKENNIGETTGDSIELTRLRRLLREVDDYINKSRNEERPPEEQAAQEDKELTRLKELLREVDDYINGKPHDHTSQ